MADETEAARVIAPRDIAFVICVEANALWPQAQLLCASIRRFAGRYADCPIVAISPRPQLALEGEAVEVLSAMGVTYVATPLNLTDHPYGAINRIVAAAWAEAELSAPYLAVLDTDTMFVGEPEFLANDVGARPVDMKGTASSGVDDPYDAYWRWLADAAGMELDRLPWLTSSVSRTTVRSSYNGGFILARRDLGVFQRTRDLFFRSFEAGLAPTPEPTIDIRASTGRVGLQASGWWGSSQASLAIAIWSLTDDVRLYDARYNIPMHLLSKRAWMLPGAAGPILLHYHFMLEAPETLLVGMATLGCPDAVIDWTREAIARLAS